MKDQAIAYLRAALGQPDAEFREGQWESIDALLNRRRLLVVERTGWGKSMVYFLATRLLRDSGAGVSLLISPLLSLMRNQIEAAARIGVKAETINHTITKPERARIVQDVRAGKVDILLVSPEQLANTDFREDVLSHIAGNVGLFVVDEAHCISDWGHDFRPDYRQIVRVLQLFPSNIPVLATTATANDRVVHDVMSQISDRIELVRGPLVRKSLKLQNITMPSPAARMAWMAEVIPTLPGTGIVYVLTKRDAMRVAEWLRIAGIDARAYHSDSLPDPGDSLLADALSQKGLSLAEFADYEAKKQTAFFREALEQALIEDRINVLVSTVALGMGFDKPNIGLVIHYQRPSSVVHYYQQVGRAGRAVEEAYGILLHGEEDDRIADFFMRNAFPPQKHISAILDALDAAHGGLSLPELQSQLNLSKGQIESALKYLSVESPSPVVKVASKWNATATAEVYAINQELIDAITEIRRNEQRQMQDYMAYDECLMEFLGRALDDPLATPCGKCANCMAHPLLSTEYDPDLANRAAIFLKRSYQPLESRKMWPSGGALPTYGFSGRIGNDLKAEEGRALSLWRDAGWGHMVAAGKYDQNRFNDDLVSACVEMIRSWGPLPAPVWVSSIPSLRRPELVPEFARRLAEALKLPCFPDALRKVRDTEEQKTMQNSFQQAHNLDRVFELHPGFKACGPCLLVDDMTDSGWTFTVAAAVLRRGGCQAVFPLALALNSPRMD